MTDTAPFRPVPYFWRLVLRRRWNYLAGVVSVILLDAVDMLPALILRRVTDEARLNPHDLPMATYALALVGCYLTIALLRMGWRLALMIPSRTMERELRQEAYHRLLRSDFAEVSRLKIGDMVSTLTQEVGNIRTFMGPGILVLFDSCAYLLFIPTTLFYLLGWGALWVLLPFVALVLALSVVHRPLEQGHSAVSEQLGELSQYVYEEAQGAKFFRAEGLLELRRRRYDLLLGALFRRQLGNARWELGLDGTLQLVVQGSYLTVLGLAASGRGELAAGLGTLTVSLQLLDKLLWPLMAVSYLMNLWQAAAAGAKRLHQVDVLSPKSEGTLPLTAPLGRIELAGLKLRTPSGEELLRGVDFHVQAGERIALVGPVGGGKTLLLQTLAGLWEPRHLSWERFRYDGIDFRKLDRGSLRSQLSFIPQTPQIFGKSLAQNISPHLPLNSLRLHDALTEADMASDVALFPEGLRTLVGEKGMNLSGGQKQRTLVARSFHSGARLYLWDDAISALDPATARRVMGNLRRLDPGAILVLATHRLSVLAEFDRVLVMEGGRVSRVGRPDEIRRDHALFASLERQEREAVWTP